MDLKGYETSASSRLLHIYRLSLTVQVCWTENGASIVMFATFLGGEPNQVFALIRWRMLERDEERCNFGEPIPSNHRAS